MVLGISLHLRAFALVLDSFLNDFVGMNFIMP